jgi:preprotein translocase subunit SecA
MEASILSHQIEGAQKKVEEQNFVARKNVLKYDDVMNTQRVVIYEQRRRVLEGDDLSGDVREWIEEIVARTVDNLTDTDFAEEWDLEGLVQAMQSLYGTDITAAELRDEVDVTSREALREEFVEDALDAYAEKEEQLGAELMRDVERYIILAVVDQRWRGHLDGMDYLREGVHLRAFAQKDPLVEYRSEGHAMFEALGQTIREEIVLTLFHAQVEVQPEQLQPEQGNGNLQYEHETTAGSEAIAGAATAGGASAVAGSSATTALAVPQTATNEHRDIGRNDPCWCGSGKKFKKCHGA